jgi:S-DNA-T family DNA segregation ATPase FtsK/SpoIIIE
MAEKRLITVSELRCAVLDPDWRRRWLAGENPPTFGFQRGGSTPVHGALFHELASDFTGWLIAGGGQGERAGLAGAEALWAELHDRFAATQLHELAWKGAGASAIRLAHSLRAFCGRVAALRERAGEGFQSWNDVYLSSEYGIERVPFAGHDGTLCIAGRPDAVRHRPGAGIEVVDYKLSRGGSLDRDLVQLAIYARLLREVKPGLQFAGVLEYYEPDLHEVTVTIPELDGLWEETIEPVVRELARAPTAKPIRRGPTEGALMAPAGSFDQSAGSI